MCGTDSSIGTFCLVESCAKETVTPENHGGKLATTKDTKVHEGGKLATTKDTRVHDGGKLATTKDTKVHEGGKLATTKDTKVHEGRLDTKLTSMRCHANPR
ncbi:MAG TPA: hypothetical protein VMT67_14330 [Terriglobales bacterium]|nr:hypothetical protein [Terriglobales bacterium]